MAVLCIVVAEGTGGFEPGDVAFCKEDGARWGSAILNNPKFRLVELPGMSGRDATARFCARQLGDLRENPNLEKRAVKINIQSLRKGQIVNRFEQLTEAELNAVREVKPVKSGSQAQWLIT